MTRAPQFKTILAFLMLPLVISATPEIKNKHEKTKTINKEFAVNSNATLKINNRWKYRCYYLERKQNRI